MQGHKKKAPKKKTMPKNKKGMNKNKKNSRGRMY